MSPSPLPGLTLASILIKKAGGLGVRTEMQTEFLLPIYVQHRAAPGPLAALKEAILPAEVTSTILGQSSAL